MEGAFSIPVVTEWNSGLEVKQPEITKDWACCRGSWRQHSTKQGVAAQRPKGEVLGSELCLKPKQLGRPWAFLGAGGTDPILSRSLKASSHTGFREIGPFPVAVQGPVQNFCSGKGGHEPMWGPSSSRGQGPGSQTAGRLMVSLPSQAPQVVVPGGEEASMSSKHS